VLQVFAAQHGGVLLFVHVIGVWLDSVAGTLVVADLTDPMMSADEACGVFQVLLEQFRGAAMPGKVIAFDEAHKYLSHKGPGCTELSQVCAR
jgi:hypothetical protein